MTTEAVVQTEWSEVADQDEASRIAWMNQQIDAVASLDGKERRRAFDTLVNSEAALSNDELEQAFAARLRALRTRLGADIDAARDYVADLTTAADAGSSDESMRRAVALRRAARTLTSDEATALREGIPTLSSHLPAVTRAFVFRQGKSEPTEKKPFWRFW